MNFPRRWASLAVGVGLVAFPAAAADLAVERWTLAEGTDLLLVEDHRVPLAHVVVEFPVGTWSPWAVREQAGKAFAIQPYDPGGRLRARADALSIDLTVEMGSHASTITVSCHADDLEAALALVADVLANREFDEHELRRWTKAGKINWKTSQKQPEFRLAQAEALRLYAGDDPRRRAYEPPAQKRTDTTRLAATRDTVVRLPRRAIGFAGDVTRERAERLAVGLLPPPLAEAPEGLEPHFSPLTPMDELPAEQELTMPRIQQAFFAYGRHSLTWNDPRYPAFLVADHVLGGHFFSRMYVALRHEGGETYGAGTRGRGGLYPEGYALETFTRGDNAAETEAKLRAVLERLHADGITEEERQAAVGFLLGERPFRRQAPSQILARALWERRHGLPPGFHDGLTDRAAAVPLAEINAFILDFYDPAGFRMLKLSPR